MAGGLVSLGIGVDMCLPQYRDAARVDSKVVPEGRANAKAKLEA